MTPHLLLAPSKPAQSGGPSRRTSPDCATLGWQPWRLRTAFAASFCLLFVGMAGADSPAAQTNALRPWTEYRAIMWMGDSPGKQPEKLPLFFQRMKEMGINTAMVYGDADPKPILDQHVPYYVENLVNKGLCLKWNSKVRDWDSFVTTWTKTGRSSEAFVRDYCLDDPAWRGWAREQMERAARRNAPHQPVAYDIRDELSVTISANPFDYDFNQLALAGFRAWLQTQYKDLAALNSQWETRFASWHEVKPFSTDQIKNRMASGDALPRGNPDWQAVQRLKFEPAAARKRPTAWNLSPWADFRTYMDLSLARVLDELRRASHAVDPKTPVGIEGTQMPHAFGGYDLWRLSQALDWVEPYDIGNAREIFGSFMPGSPLMTTVFEKETPAASRRLWHLLLEGDRGCIIWWSEDCIDWRSPDYALTPKAKALAPVLKEMSSPLAHLFLRADKEYDPVFLHYSQPSVQVDWLLESTVDGSTWHRRFSSFEAEHNRMAKVREAWLKLLQDAGLSPRFISSEELEQGALEKRRAQILVLPTSRALSDHEAAAIRAFLANSAPSARPRVVFSDGTPGLFDQHGRLRPDSPLGDSFGTSESALCSFALTSGRPKAEIHAGDIAKYAVQRLQTRPNTEWAAWVAANLPANTNSVRVRAQTAHDQAGTFEARARIHRFKLGQARLLAFERNISYHMSEDLKQAGGNEALEKPVDLEAILAQPAHVFDLRTPKYLGRLDRFSFRLDPWQPSLFALLPSQIAESELFATLQAEAGLR